MVAVSLPSRRRDERPWGYFDQFTGGEPSTVKILHVRAGEEFSLQTHAHRDEFWRIIAGSGSVIIGEQTHPAEIAAEFWIPRTVAHRAMGGSENDLEILEISFGQFDENDIVRLADTYGRT